jgi:hypothetical protein
MTFVGYANCPKCKRTASLETTTIRAKLSIVEAKQREVAKRMVKDLLGGDFGEFSVKFPATSEPEVRCYYCGLKEKI